MDFNHIFYVLNVAIFNACLFMAILFIQVNLAIFNI